MNQHPDSLSRQKVNLLLAAIREHHQVLILPHNDPDPDAIASAAAVQHLIDHLTPIEAKIGYRGIIGRTENRALAQYLNYPLSTLGKTLPLGIPVVLVDTQPGTGNNPWRPEMLLVAVVDHHPFRAESNSAIAVDVRPAVGSTAAIIYEYFTTLALPLSTKLATALFYAIKTDTRGLSRGVSELDASAYFQLQSKIDSGALADIERAQVPASYFRAFANSLEKTRLFKDVAVTHLGQMEYPDMAAEMADLLVRLETITWVVCTGIYKNKLLLAVRATEGTGDAGILVRKIVKVDGTAGGHDTMAGGQIPLQATNLSEIIDRLQQRLYLALDINPDTTAQPLV